MSKNTILLILGLTAWLGSPKSIFAAREVKVSATPTEVASATATMQPTMTPVRENITEPGNSGSIYRLEGVLEKNRSGNWNGLNSVRKIEEIAISRGVAANTIVLLLLLPLIATLVAVLHYLIGLSGYGIFMPTMIAVALLATGVLGGLTLFAIILTISLASNLVLKKLRLHFWPARSINLILISVGTFGFMVLSSYSGLLDISKISIFPILFMILLAEEFVRTQLTKSKSEAKVLMLGTLVLAIVGAEMMNVRQIQEWVLLHPEISLALGVVVNIAVGNYSGIRLMEIGRFRKAIREKQKSLKKKG